MATPMDFQRAPSSTSSQQKMEGVLEEDPMVWILDFLSGWEPPYHEEGSLAWWQNYHKVDQVYADLESVIEEEIKLGNLREDLSAANSSALSRLETYQNIFQVATAQAGPGAPPPPKDLVDLFKGLKI